MPLYEYQCDGKCGQRFEKIQKFSDPPLDKCPQCGGPIHKLQSSPAFHLKGSGWYVTDYARKDQGSSGKSESGGSTSSETKDAKPSTESSEKPAEKKSSDTSTTTPTTKETKDTKETKEKK